MAETIVIGAGRAASLPKTGQIASYQNYDDGFYEAGQDTPSTRFEDCGDGTVFDRHTNLYWPKQPELMCVGSAFPDGGQIGDDFGSGGSQVRGDWADATAYKKGDLVNSQFLPGLYYICKADHTGGGGGSNEPSNDTTNWVQTVWATINSDSAESWTKGADTVLTMTAHAFLPGELVTISGVTYDVGTPSAVNGTMAIKSVATDTITLETDTSAEGTPDDDAGTVRGAKATTANWSTAVVNCASLEYAGQTDWRLPNVMEISSLLNYAARGPSLYSEFDFTCWDSSDTTRVWSSTTRHNDSASAWRVGFGVSYKYFLTKTSDQWFIPVRGGIV